MTSFKELTVEELQSISGGGWSLLLRLAKVVGGAILAYYTVETIQGVEEGIAMECCDCECP